ncbi:MAG: hypothetical protein OHK0039_15210 [Bacteroidia bacterium]
MRQLFVKTIVLDRPTADIRPGLAPDLVTYAGAGQLCLIDRSGAGAAGVRYLLWDQQGRCVAQGAAADLLAGCLSIGLPTGIYNLWLHGGPGREQFHRFAMYP